MEHAGQRLRSQASSHIFHLQSLSPSPHSHLLIFHFRTAFSKSPPCRIFCVHSIFLSRPSWSLSVFDEPL
ncbi:hypothetical protein HBI82_168310 [Parastagonospora nodorum]|nr:hypothetical protein HBI82_168310 [Parastagonospora nodorum]